MAKEKNVSTDNKIELQGDRIATWMYYFETPEKGGETVFPRIGIKVKAFKRSALFWYNLSPSGHNDWRTLHVYFLVIKCLFL